MLITKKINNNVAMAQDADGHELVVFGKGIGFRQTPYELEETLRSTAFSGTWMTIS